MEGIMAHTTIRNPSQERNDCRTGLQLKKKKNRATTTKVFEVKIYFQYFKIL